MSDARPAVPFQQPLQRAAQATGVSFDYLAKTAERESRFDPNARASTSSATGMFQFLDQTWLDVVRTEGPKLGLAAEAQAITRDGNRFAVADPTMRKRIMALREDPATASMMAGAFAARNGQALAQGLGRKPTEGELYVAHFLGPTGAHELIQLREQDPKARAASQFPEAAAANRNIFFDRAGRARSVDEVYANLTAPFAPTQVAGLPSETAANHALAHGMFRVKGEGKPLHGLFRSNGDPVADSVSRAWGGLGRQAAQEATRVAFFPGEARTTVQTPVAAPPTQPVRRSAQPTAAPLDLMRFTRGARGS